MQTTMKTYFYLSCKRKNRKGEAPVYCRVSHNSMVRKDFATGIFLRPDEWDFKRSIPKTNSKQAVTRLNDIQQDVYAAILTCERRNVYNPYEVVMLYRQKCKQDVYTIKAVVNELLS